MASPAGDAQVGPCMPLPLPPCQPHRPPRPHVPLALVPPRPPPSSAEGSAQASPAGSGGRSSGKRPRDPDARPPSPPSTAKAVTLHPAPPPSGPAASFSPRPIAPVLDASLLPPQSLPRAPHRHLITVTVQTLPAALRLRASLPGTQPGPCRAPPSLRPCSWHISALQSCIPTLAKLTSVVRLPTASPVPECFALPG